MNQIIFATTINLILFSSNLLTHPPAPEYIFLYIMALQFMKEPCIYYAPFKKRKYFDAFRNTVSTSRLYILL